MSTFAYVGRNRQGAVKKGELTAKTRDEAVDQLRKQQVVVTSLEEKSGMGGKFKFSLGSGLTDKDLVVFTRQFGTMINAGLPLIQCLDILSTQSENKVLRALLASISFTAPKWSAPTSMCSFPIGAGTRWAMRLPPRPSSRCWPLPV